MSENSTNSKSWHDSYGALAKREEEPVAFGAPKTKKPISTRRKLRKG